MAFQLINRRVHLYLGMFLMPWVLTVRGQFFGLQPPASHLRLGRPR